MAEQETDSGEKEFEASEQKKLQARQEGNVPQSKEANTLALIVGILCTALLLHNTVGGVVFRDFSAFLYHADAYSHDIFKSTGHRTVSWLLDVLVHISPLFLVLFVVVLTALILQRTIVVSLKKIKPDIKKLSPVKNLKQRYGPRGLLDFVKDTAKLFLPAPLPSHSSSSSPRAIIRAVRSRWASYRISRSARFSN